MLTQLPNLPQLRFPLLLQLSRTIDLRLGVRFGSRQAAKRGIQRRGIKPGDLEVNVCRL